LHGHHKKAIQSSQFHPVCFNGLFDRVTQSASEPVDLVSQSSSSSVRVTLKSCYIFLLFLLFSLKTDHDECSGSNPVCDDNASCQNNHGSYDCFCKVGFTGDGKTCDGKMIAII